MALSETTPEPIAPRKRPIYKDYNLLQLGAIIFLLDQFTKYLVRQLLPFRSSFPEEGFFRFTHTHNTGSAFGILQGLNTPLIFISFTGIIILVLIYRSQSRPSNWLRLSLALQLGGAFGNLVDRLRLGWVTDFIDVGPWPVFNIADASIVTGLVLLAWVFTRSGPSREPVKAPAREGQASPEAQSSPTSETSEAVSRSVAPVMDQHDPLHPDSRVTPDAEPTIDETDNAKIGESPPRADSESPNPAGPERL